MQVDNNIPAFLVWNNMDAMMIGGRHFVSGGVDPPRQNVHEQFSAPPAADAVWREKEQGKDAIK